MLSLFDRMFPRPLSAPRDHRRISLPVLVLVRSPHVGGFVAFVCAGSTYRIAATGPLRSPWTANGVRRMIEAYRSVPIAE